MRTQQIAVMAAASLSAASASQQELEHSDAKRWGTYSDQPEMPYDLHTARPCTLWYNNDGSQSCHDVLGRVHGDLVNFLSLNPSIIFKDGGECLNFNKGQAYCLEITEIGTITSTVYTKVSLWPTTALITPTKPPSPTASKESSGRRLENAPHALYGALVSTGFLMAWL